MGLAAVWLYSLMLDLLPGSALVRQALRLGVSIGGAVGVLAFASSVLKIKEFQQGLDLVLRRLRRRPR
jgi:hypothetical protein